MDDKTLRREFREGRAGQRMVAVVLRRPPPSPPPPRGRVREGVSGKTYRPATEKDLETFRRAEKALEEKIKNRPWDFNPVPDEPTPLGGGSGASRAFSVHKYGMDTWGDLFNPRQKLALITFVEKVRRAYERMVEEGYDEEHAKAVMTYLALAFDRLADKNATLVVYNAPGEKIEHVFGRQALPMVWDYAEVNPFTDVGWPNMMDWITRFIEYCIASTSG